MVYLFRSEPEDTLASGSMGRAQDTSGLMGLAEPLSLVPMPLERQLPPTPLSLEGSTSAVSSDKSSQIRRAVLELLGQRITEALLLAIQCSLRVQMESTPTVF